jgi:hypothetical protein
MTESEQRAVFDQMTALSGLTYEEGREEMMFTVAKQIFTWSAVLGPTQDPTLEPATAYAPVTVTQTSTGG